MWWAGLLLLVVVAGAGRLPASGDIVIGSRVKNQAVSQDEGSQKENLPPGVSVVEDGEMVLVYGLLHKAEAVGPALAALSRQVGRVVSRENMTLAEREAGLQAGNSSSTTAQPEPRTRNVPALDHLLFNMTEVSLTDDSGSKMKVVKETTTEMSIGDNKNFQSQNLNASFKDEDFESSSKPQYYRYNLATTLSPNKDHGQVRDQADDWPEVTQQEVGKQEVMEEPHLTSGVWEVYWDTEYQAWYYYNKVTGTPNPVRPGN